MKKILVCMLAVLLVLFSMTTAFAAADAKATDDEAAVGEYSVVSAVVNRSYDFKEDFHDSYPYDEDFRTEGIFKLNDVDPDVTLTLKNNSTGEEFVYEKNAETEYYVRTQIDYLLYETTELDAVLNIVTLGEEYDINDVDIPVTIKVVSSQYSADFHKYPSYVAITSMTEDDSYTLKFDPTASKCTATVTVLKLPHIFQLSLYNVETKQTEYYDDTNGVFKFQEKVEVVDFKPSCTRFWFFVPVTLVMDDGYEYEFTLSVDALRKNNPLVNPTDAPTVAPTDKSTKDSPATSDSSGTTNGSKTDSGAVQTGDSIAAFILSLTVLIAAAGLMLYVRKRKIKE